MKNLFFIDPQSYSNLAVYDYNLLNSNEEFDITFFGNKLYSYKKFDGLNFIPLFKYSKYQNNLLKSLSYFISILKILKYIIIKNPRIIHIQWIKLWHIDYYWVFLIKYFTDIKILYTAHNVLPHESGEKQKKQYNKFYHLVDIVITHTHTSKNELIDIFKLKGHKIKVIPHGLLDYDLDLHLVENTKNNFKTNFSTDSKIVFTSLGQQSNYKGSDIIAKVWAETKELHDSSKYRLLILGKNTSIDFSSLYNIENVFIENRFVNDEEFKSILGLTNLLLLPYRQISQSGVLLSAINESVPVLVSNAGGLSETLAVANIGWNIGEASFDNLQKSLLFIINNSHLLNEMKNASSEWEKVKTFYDWSHISETTFELYKSLLK